MKIYLLAWPAAQAFAKPIRYRVFVSEQGVPEEMEWDEYDEHAIHALAFIDDQAVGTARLKINNQTAKIGRMAVLAEQRRQGVGFAMLDALVKEAREQQIARIELHAQVQVTNFYEKLGFKQNGPIFDEAGIDHVLMTLQL